MSAHAAVRAERSGLRYIRRSTGRASYDRPQCALMPNAVRMRRAARSPTAHRQCRQARAYPASRIVEHMFDDGVGWFG